MKKNKRDFKQPIIWKGDLKDDCTAEWAGLMLRAECMDENDWWWCVYDMLDEENQIDSSNEHEERITEGESAREKAEKIAKNYLKEELVAELKSSNTKTDFDKLISDLKSIGISPMFTILTLIKDFGFEYREAKELVFDSPVWKGLRKQSKQLYMKYRKQVSGFQQWFDKLIDSLM